MISVHERVGNVGEELLCVSVYFSFSLLRLYHQDHGVDETRHYEYDQAISWLESESAIPFTRNELE